MSINPPAQYLEVPANIINQAIDLLGESGKIIGDISDGTTVAETARRNYGRALRQLLRTAHWAWARSNKPLTLLGDATGNSAPPISTYVEAPWTYAYAWPLDGVQGRWMPWNPTNAQPSIGGVPLTTGVSALTQYPLTPGRFLVSSSDQYPVVVGVQPWDQLPDLQRTEGVGPVSRKIILTDCCQAYFVYTRLVTVIEEWDDLFRQALVMMMAMVLAPVAIEDPKVRMAVLAELRPALKNAVDNARVANGNEAGMPMTIDQDAAYIRARNQGWGPFGAIAFGPGGVGYNIGGYYGYGWDALSWGGSVF